MTTTKTETKTKTETETKVSAAVLSVVREFLKTKIKADEAKAKADAQIESKYWPMVEQALKMFEGGDHREDIQAEFREAFKQTHVGELASRHESTYRLMAANVTKIAYKGRAWVEEQRETGLGFWATLKLITDPPSSTPEPEASANGKAKASTAKPGARATKPAKGQGKKSGNVNVREGKASEAASESTAYDLDAIMEVIEETPIVFVEIVDKVLETSMVPFDTLEKVYKAIAKHLKKA